VNKRKLIIISDLHIGGDEIIEDFSCEEEVISFLDEKGKYSGELELMILGDFFDLWKVENDADEQVEFIIKKHQKMFDAFKQFGEKHEITALPGNHDHALSYNKKYQEDLAAYNIKVDPTQFFKREFKNGERTFKIIGEHGNQVEPSSEFPEFGMPTDSSLAYHINKILVYKLMRMGNEKKSPEWLRDLDNIETDLILYWGLSKYFYYELGPILKAVLIPMFILFSFAIPYFIFDVITEFYQPKFIQPLLTLLDTNTFFKILIFLMYFNMVMVIIVFFAWLLKRDFRKRLKEYGVHSFTDILVSRYHAYKKRAKEVVNGENDFEEKADFYVNGHTHAAGLHHLKEDKVSFVDTGSWKQLMKRVSARFRFPSVYAPYFALTYATFEREEDEMVIKLKKWPKEFKAKLTMLERFVISGKKIPKPIMADKVVHAIKLPFKKVL
jgi:UDP-2,3-diacylglucosamine pyrophosphatase LpxH